LLHGEDDFQKSLMIVNTCGWDTDCNSGNVGCLLGIKNGLAGIEAGPDWRGPVADRLYLPTADGGRAISDAVTETYHIVNIGRVLAGQAPEGPKQGARFHFELPGSVQGFMPEESVEVKGVASLENVAGHSQAGRRSLAIRYNHLAPGRAARVATPTFIPSEEVASYFDKRGYSLLASPALYSGQVVRAALEADDQNGQPVRCNLYIRVYGPEDRLALLRGPQVELAAGARQELSWKIDDTGGSPIAEIGVEVSSERPASGSIYLDYLTWAGAPEVTFRRPEHSGYMWRRAWVNGVDVYGERWWPETYRVIQNEGRGLLIQGTRDWNDYQVSAAVTPHMVESAGIGARVQGLRRFYALLLGRDKKVRLVKALDGDTVLAEADYAWYFGGEYRLSLKVVGNKIRAGIDGQMLFEIEDSDRPLTGGGVALICEEGRMATDAVMVQPAG